MSDQELKQDSKTAGASETHGNAGNGSPTAAGASETHGNARNGSPVLGSLALIALVLSIPVAIFWPSLVGIDGTFMKLKALAVSATVVGAFGAGARLWAHKGSTRLDAAGKILGFISALLAMWATAALFLYLSVTGKG